MALILPPGSLVWLKLPVPLPDRNDGFLAVVNKIMFEGSHHQYLCSWYDGSDRKEQWVQPHEVVPTNGVEYRPVGFHSNPGVRYGS